MKRDWSLANQKRVPVCRVCGRADLRIELAHVIGREHDRKDASICEFEDDRTGVSHSIRLAVVLPDRVVPLCQKCHGSYDSHRLDLWDHLTKAERFQAIEDAGGVGQALRRCAPLSWDGRVEIRDGVPVELTGEPS